jgi:hypothetical protein
MLADPICCWDQSGMPVLLIDRRRDGSGVIIRNCVTTQLSKEDVSRLHFTNPAQPDPQPKVKQARRDDDGQASLRRELRHNPAALHTMAAQLGLPASAADELLRELFESVGEIPPQPMLRRARGGRAQEPPAQPQADQQVSSGVDRLPLPMAPADQLQRPASQEQRTSALRSEVVRDEALSSRLTAIRLKDLSSSSCPRVRDGYAWFTSLQRKSMGFVCTSVHNTYRTQA